MPNFWDKLKLTGTGLMSEDDSQGDLFPPEMREGLNERTQEAQVIGDIASMSPRERAEQTMRAHYSGDPSGRVPMHDTPWFNIQDDGMVNYRGFPVHPLQADRVAAADRLTRAPAGAAPAEGGSMEQAMIEMLGRAAMEKFKGRGE
jgi:hypothetical protein